MSKDPLALNGLNSAIAEHCSRHRTEEKWLVAPSLRVGYQWMDAVARAGQPVLNLRIKTMKGMALDLAGPDMATKGVGLIAPEGAAILVDLIASRLLRGEFGYLAGLETSAGLSQAMLSAIESIRLAGIETKTIRPRAFEATAKAKDIGRLLDEYLRQLEALKLVDYAAVLRMARDRLKSDPAALGAIR